MLEINEKAVKTREYIPLQLKKKLNQSKLKLYVIIIVWLSIAIYSYIATFLGYKQANLGNLAIILALASQIFTMIYAIPDVGEIRKRIFRVGTIPFWITICLSAHVISFGGSAFYHFMKISSIKGRADQATSQQVRLLHETQNEITFNTIDYISFQKGLSVYYADKAIKSNNGTGVSSKGGRGNRVKLFENLSSELENEISLTKSNFPPEDIVRFTDPKMDIRIFVNIAGGISSTIKHPESNIEDINTALQIRSNLIASKPAFDYDLDETLPTKQEAREIIRKYTSRYPYVKIVIPYDELVTGGGKIKNLRNIFSLSSFKSYNEEEKYGVVGGLFAATIIEVSMLIINLFFVIQGKNLKAIRRRSERESIIDNSMEITTRSINRYVPFTHQINGTDLSAAITVLSISIGIIKKNLDINSKMLCTELSSRPREVVNRSGFLSRLWQEVGLGYEAIYYKINDKWIDGLINNNMSLDDIYEDEDITILDDETEIWEFLIVSVIKSILDHLERSGELIVQNGSNWIDLSDFSNWLNGVIKITGLRGALFPGVEIEKKNITWKELVQQSIPADEVGFQRKSKDKQPT